jgi:hypothetical protein
MAEPTSASGAAGCASLAGRCSAGSSSGAAAAKWSRCGNAASTFRNACSAAFLYAACLRPAQHQLCMSTVVETECTWSHEEGV